MLVSRRVIQPIRELRMRERGELQRGKERLPGKETVHPRNRREAETGTPMPGGTEWRFWKLSSSCLLFSQ